MADQINLISVDLINPNHGSTSTNQYDDQLHQAVASKTLE